MKLFVTWITSPLWNGGCFRMEYWVCVVLLIMSNHVIQKNPPNGGFKIYKKNFNKILYFLPYNL